METFPFGISGPSLCVQTRQRPELVTGLYALWTLFVLGTLAWHGTGRLCLLTTTCWCAGRAHTRRARTAFPYRACEPATSR